MLMGLSASSLTGTERVTSKDLDLLLQRRGYLELEKSLASDIGDLYDTLGVQNGRENSCGSTLRQYFGVRTKHGLESIQGFAQP
jgi:hypothetical protein